MRYNAAMDRARLSVPLSLIALSLLFIGLPERLTGSAKLLLLGALRPLAAAAPPPAEDRAQIGAPAAAPPADRDGELEWLRDQNQRLIQQVAELREQNAQLRAEMQNIRELRRVVREGTWYPIPAPVILAADPSVWHRTMVIARGTDDGVTPGDPVVWGPRLIGQVAKEGIGPKASRVRLITDGGFRIAALIASTNAERTTTERLTGVLEGQGVDTCALQWILHDTIVEPGCPVVTAEDPLSNIPPYLLIGRVSEVQPQSGPYLRVRVRPSLRFQNLTWVHVYKWAAAPATQPPPRERGR